MYQNLLGEWKNTLSLIESVGGETYCKVEMKATNEEIVLKEKQLGIKLPFRFTNALLDFSKDVQISWKFPYELDAPKFIEEVYSGEIGWQFAKVSIVSTRGGQSDKLVFHYTANGDFLAFDLASSSDDPRIIYWDDDEETEILLASNFDLFLQEMTNLHFVGGEHWQLRYFLGRNGLDSTSEIALKWKQWLENEINVNDKEIDITNLNDIFELIFSLNRLRKNEITILSSIPKDLLFNLTLSKMKTTSYLEQKLLCFIMGEILKNEVSEWVESLWESENELIVPGMRSYLSSKCLPKEKGLSYVLEYVQKEQLDGFGANEHLKYFRANHIIVWMQENAKLPYEGWDYLFAYSNPTWKDIETWLNLDFKHKVICVNSLAVILRLSKKQNAALPYEDEPIQIFDLPCVDEVITTINNIRDTGKVKNRHYVLDELIENIKFFY
ncbi:SMI1/KNR4 family protein [Bacillus cihuensis]|uniref:SMI1/KNR4 family protein n=1 Tax=Bacillus cihuensis TaxID=1208599 RepID=UPI000402F251|nr:SMI1/KNR4 family protein [Bacillus cihuensis]